MSFHETEPSCSRTFPPCAPMSRGVWSSLAGLSSKWRAARRAGPRAVCGARMRTAFNPLAQTALMRIKDARAFRAHP